MTSPTSTTARAVLLPGATREVAVGELTERLRERGVEHLALRRASVVTAAAVPARPSSVGAAPNVVNE